MLTSLYYVDGLQASIKINTTTSSTLVSIPKTVDHVVTGVTVFLHVSYGDEEITVVE